MDWIGLHCKVRCELPFRPAIELPLRNTVELACLFVRLPADVRFSSECSLAGAVYSAPSHNEQRAGCSVSLFRMEQFVSTAREAPAQ